MYFDILIPMEFKNKRNEAVYYRQEVAINNINLKEGFKQLALKYSKKNELYNYKNNFLKMKKIK